ncbi:hypothetical protein LYSIN_00217 [Lysinibacillus sphaericus]|uniref:Uncharacterized protein n=1 Tax=Lysinibacillus sphaericus TaxID=1421 RepID=A0A2S5CX93_LYSSH|nr:hypothetical protein LYSIN_00217 [Lysinibacillus sphaericus]
MGFIQLTRALVQYQSSTIGRNSVAKIALFLFWGYFIVYENCHFVSVYFGKI